MTPGQADILGVSFGGRLVVVTGGARGQGALQARHLAARGAQVIVADILEDEGRALADEIGAQFARLDVTSEADWAALVLSRIHPGQAIRLRLQVEVGPHGALHGQQALGETRELQA